MRKVVLVEPPPWDTGSPNLGIAYLKSVLQDAGYEASTLLLSPYFYEDEDIKRMVRGQQRIFQKGHVFNIYFDFVWDAYVEGDVEKREVCEAFLDGWVEKLQRCGAEVIGFSLNHLTLPLGLRLASKLRGRGDFLLVAGGPTASTLQEVLLPFFDVICVGEGEVMLQEVVDFRDAPERLKRVQGVITRSEDGVHRNPPRELLGELDALPFPDFTDIPRGKYAAIPIQTSRGCVAGCAFCDETVYWSRYRRRSPEGVVDEIEHQSRRYGVRNFRFHDSLINGSPKHLERMCSLIIERGLEVEWGGNARVVGLSEELAHLMADAGCRYLLFGIESASQRVLDAMRKKTSVEQILSALEACDDAGIWTHTHWMTGFPAENWEDVEETAGFIKMHRKVINSATVHPFTMPTRFCQVFNKPQNYGITEVYPKRIINLFGIELVWEYGFKVAGRPEDHVQRATRRIEATLEKCRIPDIIFPKSLQGRILKQLYVRGALRYFRKWLPQY